MRVIEGEVHRLIHDAKRCCTHTVGNRTGSCNRCGTCGWARIRLAVVARRCTRCGRHYGVRTDPAAARWRVRQRPQPDVDRDCPVLPLTGNAADVATIAAPVVAVARARGCLLGLRAAFDLRATCAPGFRCLRFDEQRGEFMMLALGGGFDAPRRLRSAACCGCLRIPRSMRQRPGWGPSAWSARRWRRARPGRWRQCAAASR